MAFKILARTREKTGSTGTGDILVSGLISADNVVFSAGMNVGDTAFVTLLDADGVKWQEFLGTYSAANTIQRTSTIKNHLGNTADISLSAGTHRIFAIGFPSDWNALFFQLGGGDYTKALLGDGTFGTPVTGLHFPTAFATAAALPANTYANGTAGVGATLTGNVNGALVVDGFTITGAVSYRILVKDEVDLKHNGIYVVTQAGDLTHPYILTRATDFDQPADVIQDDLVFNGPNGGANANLLYVIESDSDPIVYGTTEFTIVAVTSAAGGGGSPAGSTNAVQYNAGSGAFGAVGPLTDGQLVVGRTGLAPVAATLTAGAGISITNASGSITVATSGNAAPTSASTGLTAWVNQGTATVRDGAAGVVLNDVSNGGSNTLRVRHKAAPTAPYSIKAKLALVLGPGGNGAITSIGWDDGTKFQDIGLHIDSTGATKIAYGTWSNSTTNASFSDLVTGPVPNPIWFCMVNDSANSMLHFGYSLDGESFILLVDHATPDYLTALTNVFFQVNPNGARVFATLEDWQEIAGAGTAGASGTLIL